MKQETARRPMLALRAAGSQMSWQAMAEEPLCVGYPGKQFLFGGITLAGCVEALERSTRMPAIYVASQFRSMVRPGEEMRFDVEAEDAGTVRQASVRASVGGREIALVTAAVGERGEDAVREAFAPPTMPDPDICRPASMARLMSSNIHRLFEVRVASASLPDGADWTCAPTGQGLFWMRARSGEPAGRALLAILGDFLAIGIPGAQGRMAGGTSLDNHVRFVASSECEWVACETRILAIGRGLIHGELFMRDPDGHLLALASQSMVARG